MHDAQKNPCADCPFRKNSLPGWLGDWDNPYVLSAHIMAPNKFPCHLTMNDATDYEDMGLNEPLDKSTIDDLILYDSKECRGSQLYRDKNGYKQVTDSSVANILSCQEFINHHNQNREDRFRNQV